MSDSEKSGRPLRVDYRSPAGQRNLEADELPASAILGHCYMSRERLLSNDELTLTRSFGYSFGFAA